MKDPRIEELLKKMVELKASDLHLTVGFPPTMRVNEDLCPLDQPALKPEEVRELAYALLSPMQRQRWHRRVDPGCFMPS